MLPSIFLSHSCKDRDSSPPAGLSADERRRRLDRLDFARRLRRALDDRLRATGRYHVWLDRRALRAGQDWRDGIHQALRGCAGAVILLSPEALESRWVLKETTILAWRVFLGEPVLMIPVLLGIDETDLVARGFEPSGVAAIQAEVVPDVVAAPVDEIAERIVARFDETVPEAAARTITWASTVERWLEETARLLHEDDERYLRDMFAVLGLDADDEDVDRFDADRFRTVAAELLVAGPDEILDVLHALSGVRTADQKAMLRRAVEALWVDARAANRLPHVAGRAEPPRVVAIDANEPVTGRHYVERAYCGKLRFDRIFTPDDHTDGSRDHALARIEDLLADYLPMEDPLLLAHDVAKNGPAYVVLGPGACRAGVVTELARRHPALTVVALTGRDPTSRAELPPGVSWLAPALGVREVAGRRYRNRLAAYA